MQKIQNTNTTKYKWNKIQMQKFQNINMKIQKDKIQLPKYKRYKIQTQQNKMEENTNITKCKNTKIQIRENTRRTVYLVFQ